MIEQVHGVDVLKPAKRVLERLKEFQETEGSLSKTPWSREETKNLTGLQLANFLSIALSRFKLVDYDWTKAMLNVPREDGTFFDDESLSLKHYSRDGELAWFNFLEDLKLWEQPLPSTFRWGRYEADTIDVSEEDFLNDWYHTFRVRYGAGIVGDTAGFNRFSREPEQTMFHLLRQAGVACFPDSSIPIPSQNAIGSVRFDDRRDLAIDIGLKWDGEMIGVTVKYYREEDSDWEDYYSTRVTLFFSFAPQSLNTLNYPPLMLTDYESARERWG